MTIATALPLGSTLTFDFICSDGAGAASDADSTPTSAVYEETSDTAILTPTVTKRTSLIGNYRLQVVATTANGFEVGKMYSVIASATVGSVAGKAVVATFMIGPPVYVGAVIAGAPTTTIFATDRPETTLDYWKDCLLTFVTGSLKGQVKKVSSSSIVGIMTVSSAFTAAPSTGDVFVLVDI